jgi:hypothetical protein
MPSPVYVNIVFKYFLSICSGTAACGENILLSLCDGIIINARSLKTVRARTASARARACVCVCVCVCVFHSFLIRCWRDARMCTSSIHICIYIYGTAVLACIRSAAAAVPHRFTRYLVNVVDHRSHTAPIVLAIHEPAISIICVQ